MKIKRLAYQRNLSALYSLAVLKEGNRNQTLLMCLLCFQTVCVLPNSSYNLARYLNPRWILSNTEALVLYLQHRTPLLLHQFLYLRILQSAHEEHNFGGIQ
ncbi:unnamed protein product [Gordionus sp. m RMFG-2023]